MEKNISKDNHYVSRGYLKQWESSEGKVFVYRVLVSHDNVPSWKEKSIAGVGFQEHLYTRQIAGSENDEIEHWFCREFETPAEGPLRKVLNNDRLSRDDWRALVRYLAMHDVRTPARLMEHLSTAGDSISRALSEALNEVPDALARTRGQTGASLEFRDDSIGFPLRLSTERKDGEETAFLKAETAVGRASWLWWVHHLLTKTVNFLYSHTWTIMRPALGMRWFTTDKPVIRLNYHGPSSYDFRGGWGRTGGEIIFPISPEHMIYTRIGHKPPIRGSRFSVEQTQLLRRLIAEHAHRYIFGRYPDPEVSSFRVRTVNSQIFSDEREQWKRWHREQLEAEVKLLANVTKK